MIQIWLERRPPSIYAIFIMIRLSIRLIGIWWGRKDAGDVVDKEEMDFLMERKTLLKTRSKFNVPKKRLTRE